MCKFKDTNLGIKKLDFNVKAFKNLSRKQREEWMIMDDQYFSFEAISKIFSVKDLLKV
ncbi:MAG: hypothetical protein VZQ51_03885 [Bacteroidales bacterium]|nr:hypothetical protein [Bacteroidales bacterium]